MFRRHKLHTKIKGFFCILELQILKFFLQFLKQLGPRYKEIL